jgi:hypothetical protein
MSDETYGQFSNLTLIIYPATTDLDNASHLNISVNYKLNVSHINSPVEFDGPMPDRGPVPHTSDITIDLTDYFSDSDTSDGYYNETVSFTINSNTTAITSSVSSAWVLTLASSTAVVGAINITASDGESNVTSDTFFVEFTTPPQSTSSSSGGGGGGGTRDVPYSLKIIMPDPVSTFGNEKIVLPITLHNDGSDTLYDISLNASVAVNGSIIEYVNITFNESFFPVLAAGAKKNTTMTIYMNTTDLGSYEITVYGDVRSPSYRDWGKMYITVQEGETVKEKILFIEEFIVENPECIEISERIDEAWVLFEAGEANAALLTAEEALEACRDAISQASKAKEKEISEDMLYRYLIIGTIAVFVIGIGFYTYKRIKLRKRRGSFLQESIKKKKYK